MRFYSAFFRVTGCSALILAWPFAQAFGQESQAGVVDVRLNADGRTFNLSAPGLTTFCGGFAAEVWIGGEPKLLSSRFGTRVSSNTQEWQANPYGAADETLSTFRFEKEQIDLCLSLEKMVGEPVLLLRVGVRNYGSLPVHLWSINPLEMDASISTNTTARPTRELHVSGNPEEWFITTLNANTQVFTSLHDVKKTLKIEEQGALYRKDGTGFLFGPVGKPVAYLSTRVTVPQENRTGLSICSLMGGVRVDPGQSRWGQQVAFFIEPPLVALKHWAEWVAKSHGSRISKGALSGWNSWYHLRQSVTGKDLIAITDQVLKSEGHLRPEVIEIDRGFALNPGLTLETNDKFPEGLSFYAQRIAATGARPGLRLELSEPSLSLSQNISMVKQAVQDGFSFLKISYNFPTFEPTRSKTPFELAREIYQEIRKVAGENTYILDCDQRMEPKAANRAVVGLADASRTGPDTFRAGVRDVMEKVLRASSLNGRWFAVDNDSYYMATELKDISPVVGGWPLSRTWISMVGLSCGAASTSDPWYEERFKPYWRNVEILTPPAKEQTEVLDVCTSKEWSRLVGKVKREWGEWTVALLWNPLEKEQRVTLDFAQIGLDIKKRYAVWSFWDNRFLGVTEGIYTTLFLAPSASQHICITELPDSPYKAVLIGSSLHVYCGAAEIKRVTSLRSAMQIELTDAGAREGDLFIYSPFRPVVNEAIGCIAEGFKAAGENVWQLSLRNRKPGAVQRIELGIPQPLIRQTWFWAMCAVLFSSLGYSGWWFIAWQRSKLTLSKLEQTTARQQERARIARDLHDELGTSLAQIAMLGNRAQKSLTENTLQQEQLIEIYDRSRESARRLDEIVWAVNPARDSLEYLGSYLCKFAEEYLALAEVRFRVDIPDELPSVPLDSGIRHNVFLATREAIHNAVRHGHPSTVTLRMSVEDPRFTVEIKDDGQGFDVETALAAGRGVANMRERMAQVGGELRITSTPGTGSSILFVIPITPSDRSLHAHD
ncbi:MAG: ATP-binding protein [bacterium]